MSTLDTCPCGSSDKALRRGLCRKCRKSAAALITTDRDQLKSKGEIATLRLKYSEALRRVEALEQSQETVTALRKGLSPMLIEPKFGKGTSEATAVMVASDWHIEERVDPAKINFVNEANLEINTARAERFFQSGIRLIDLLKQDVKIPTIVLPLLGDFITGQIHGAENAEVNQLTPTEATLYAQNLIVGGIQFMLSRHEGDIVVVCHSGNHARTSHQNRLNGQENGHSYEYLMYRSLAKEFKNESRIRFEIAEGYHTYLPIYDKVVRFHHGHRLRYGGGRGGLFTPTYTSIDDWNKTKRADLDVFGHFHQLRDGGNFICNGSLIGYNAYAESIKAHFEPPRQTLFLMDKKRGRTCTWPILLS